MTDWLAPLETAANELEGFGQAAAAAAVRETVRRARAARADFWAAPLSVAEAVAWGGYSASRLRGLVSDGTIPTTADGRIQRRHVPVRPGHGVPLALDPAETGIPIHERIRKQRAS